MSFMRLPFESVFADESGGNVKTPQSEYLPLGAYPVIDQSKELIGGYVDDASRLCGGGRPAIVFGDHTRCIKYIDFPFCMGADGVKVLRPKIEADLRYLYYYLQTVKLPDAGYARHYKYLKRSVVAIPAVSEQRRIAAILAQADALRSKRRQTLAHLDSLAQSIFIEIFGNPLLNSMGWPNLSLKELGRITTGRTPPSSGEGMFDGNIPFITPGDLDSRIPIKRSVTEKGAAIVGTVREGATLVCCIGTVGKLDVAVKRSAFNQQINAVEWGEEISDCYGLHALTFFKKLFMARASHTTVPILNKSKFEEIEIPVPPLDLQNVFAKKIASLEKIKLAYLSSAAEFDELFVSLKSRAFKGLI